MRLFGTHTYLDADLEAGILETWTWLMGRFGDARQMTWDPFITPTHDNFPPTPLTGDDLAADVLQRVRRLMKAEVECGVEPAGGPPTTIDGTPLIGYSDAGDPWVLVSELAHGVAALMLNAYQDELPEGRDSFWPTVSLLVVHKGFGIFALNGALDYVGFGRYSKFNKAGYFTEPTFAFVLAGYLILTNRVGAADGWIKPICRELLHDAQKYLAKNPALLQPLSA
jgi:hypothetical protein